MSAVNFNLKKVRIEKGVTQVDLSEKSGITQQQISRYETGSRIPTIEAAALIANALGVTLDELVTIREVKQKVAKKFNEIINS